MPLLSTKCTANTSTTPETPWKKAIELPRRIPPLNFLPRERRYEVATALPWPGPAAWSTPYMKAMAIKLSKGCMLPRSLASLVKAAIFWLSCCCQSPILSRKGCGTPGTADAFGGLSFAIKGFWAFAESTPHSSVSAITVIIGTLPISPFELQDYLYGMNLTIIISFFHVFGNPVINLKS